MKISEKDKSKTIQIPETLPLLPLRDLVVFPHMVVPLFVGREMSVAALDAAMSGSRLVLLSAQRDATTDDPEAADIYGIGTVAEILQLLKLPDGTIKVLVEGVRRRAIKEFLPNEEFFEVINKPFDSVYEPTVEMDATIRSVHSQFEQYVKLNKRIPPETVMSVANIEDPGKIADTVAAQLILKVKDKQELLETRDVARRIQLLLEKLTGEIEILKIEKKIRGEVRGQMEQTQREYYLTEQMKAIQKELGKRDEDQQEIEEFREKIAEAGMPDEVMEKAEKELRRLEKMSPMSAESSVVRTYLDWLVELPWSKTSDDKIDIEGAQAVLDEDHFSLDKPKKRILEYLAVLKLAKEHRGPILCMVGPPGVGKTSLAKSMARALGRNFVRMSLGGVRDEAEIRGHRRTYVGAMPGRIIQGMRKSGTINPVFLLDEIDKLASDFRGDPSSALLEVLDPEQNSSFSDHYLDVDYDLSKIMFVTTANTLHPIPRPLLDRMEVINLSGYTDLEKSEIAEQFLIPKQLKEHGLADRNVSITTGAVMKIIHEYTREAGVRNLERTIAKLCRKVARKIVEKPKEHKMVKIEAGDIKGFLGIRKYQHGQIEHEDEVGHVMGLAWTEAGGELLGIEALTMPGSGNLTLTGKLGDVMQESARAALGYARSRSDQLNLTKDFLKKTDIHIHVPEGAIPKDGPSAGITIATALISALVNKPVRREVAMTGEITLRGKVLPIGGLKEKVLAAHRAMVKEVIFPKENERHLEDIPESVKKEMKFHMVETMDEVITIAIGELEVEKPSKNKSAAKKSKKKSGKKKKS